MLKVLTLCGRFVLGIWHWYYHHLTTSCFSKSRFPFWSRVHLLSQGRRNSVMVSSGISWMQLVVFWWCLPGFCLWYRNNHSLHWLYHVCQCIRYYPLLVLVCLWLFSFLWANYWPHQIENFDQNWNFQKFWSNQSISKIFTKIQNFKDFDQNCYFCEFWPKSRYFDNFDFKIFNFFLPKSRFSKFWSQIEMFRIISKSFENYAQLLNLMRILTLIANFGIFFPK